MPGALGAIGGGGDCRRGRLALSKGGAPPETILLGETLQLVVAEVCPHYVEADASAGAAHALAACGEHYTCHDMGGGNHSPDAYEGRYACGARKKK